MPKVIDPIERMHDGFIPDPGPMIHPGELPRPPPARRLSVVDPPSLCRVGPCSRYHELTLLMASAQPLDGSVTPSAIQVVKTCYPAPGIEMPMNDLPVFGCSLWAPVDPVGAYSARGTFAVEVEAWNRDQMRLVDEIEAEAIAYASTPAEAEAAAYVKTSPATKTRKPKNKNGKARR